MKWTQQTYRTFHPNRREYTFSEPHGIFSKIDHILGNKANIHRSKKENEITTCVLSDHHGVKLEFNNNSCISQFIQIAKAEQSQQRQRGQIYIFKSICGPEQTQVGQDNPQAPCKLLWPLSCCIIRQNYLSSWCSSRGSDSVASHLLPQTFIFL